MSRTRVNKVVASLSVGALSALALGASAIPAQADTLPAPGCVTACVATFDTVSAATTFAVPANISSLSVTVSGGAGAPAAYGIPIDGVGGTGGVTTVDLGTTYGGQTLIVGVGGVGEGSYVQAPGLSLLVVAGGGGGGGYLGRLDVLDNGVPTQIFDAYPGGNGGSPTVPGVADGATPTAFGSNAANGKGGSVAGGAGGTGVVAGSAGDNSTIVAIGGSTLAAGGAGGLEVIAALNHTGGHGGSGYTGGGGGAAASVDSGDDIFVDLIAPGGGGSGFLHLGLTGVAGTPNTGTGVVTFTYSIKPTLASTGTDVPTWLPWAALLLIAAGALTVRAARRQRN
ncbi:MAG: hypothetical protein ABJB03_01805 [Rhodoglobus sp.]